MSDISAVILNDEVREHIRCLYCNDKVANEETFQGLLHWLTLPPMFTTVRVNSCKMNRETARVKLEDFLKKQYDKKDQQRPPVIEHPVLSDVLVIPNTGPHKRNRCSQQVIVDLACGMAVLRGANVFAQGIMGAPVSMQIGDEVSVYADVNGRCKRGLLKEFTEQKVFVGNGIAQLSRNDLFCGNKKISGVGVVMKQPLFDAPALNDLPDDTFFPQNLPSVVCSHVLDPKPGERILDMCAAPGGKTTHIATLMNDQGVVIALDKASKKRQRIESNAEKFALKSVHAFECDSRHCIRDGTDENSMDAALTSDPCPPPPPYPAEYFDRVLLDAPCSALGQRPSFRSRLSAAELGSYPSLQRQLLAQAVAALKPGGVLVYSTCTVTMSENEDQVAWVLRHYPELKLVPQEPHLGGVGLRGCRLAEDDRTKVQRFPPEYVLRRHGKVTDDIDTIKTSDSVDTHPPIVAEGITHDKLINLFDHDTIGFFIAKFIKIK